MKDPQFIGNESSRPVKDVMDPAVRIDLGVTVKDALQRFGQQEVQFGVISSPQGDPFAIVTKEQLGIANLDEQVQAFAKEEPLHIVIQPHESFDTVVQQWANDFKIYPDLTGIFVQEHGDILGVLPREKIEAYALNMAQGDYVGNPVGTLPGNPPTITETTAPPDGEIILAPGEVLYICSDCPHAPECPQGPDRRGIAQLNPYDPPKCKWKNKPMIVYEEE